MLLAMLLMPCCIQCLCHPLPNAGLLHAAADSHLLVISLAIAQHKVKHMPPNTADIRSATEEYHICRQLKCMLLLMFAQARDVYTVTRVLHATDPCRGGDVCRTRVLPHRVPTRVDGRVHTVHAPTRVLWPYTRLAKFRDGNTVAFGSRWHQPTKCVPHNKL